MNRVHRTGVMNSLVEEENRIKGRIININDKINELEQQRDYFTSELDYIQGALQLLKKTEAENDG